MSLRKHYLLLTLLLSVTAACRGQYQSNRSSLSSVAMPASIMKVESPSDEVPIRERELTSVPRTLRDLSDIEYHHLSLQDAIRDALANSKILRDLGGTVVRTPVVTATSFDPSVVETDPRFGVEAALSAFDAQLDSALTAENLDRRMNNRFAGDVGILTGKFFSWDAGISKRTVAGTQFALRRHMDHERDNNPGNEFANGAWNVWYEAEARHPLLQGGGVQFNRIAGPGASPGFINGVLVARVRSDISLADFEIGLRDFVSNVENAYWDLYYSYRDLDAKVRARDVALETWRRIEALNVTGRRGGEAEKEAQAREQYFRFEADAQDSLAGRPLDGTRTNNGSLAGTFRGIPGVLVNEKRLRLIMNVPQDSQRLICPSDEPTTAAVIFEWPTLVTHALVRRGELKRQRWQIRQREYELIAAKNFLLPQLDVFGRYRVRGFGDRLIDTRGDRPRFDNAYGDLMTGDFNEWQAGLEMEMPIGFRQAHVNVRNSTLRLARERAVLAAQEEEVVYGLSQAVAEADRAFIVMQTTYNRYQAAHQQVAAVETAYQDDRIELIAVLDAQRRLAEAESQLYRARTEYAVSLKNVHFEKGTLLEYGGVAYTESAPWDNSASHTSSLNLTPVVENPDASEQRSSVTPTEIASPVQNITTDLPGGAVELAQPIQGSL